MDVRTQIAMALTLLAKNQVASAVVVLEGALESAPSTGGASNDRRERRVPEGPHLGEVQPSTGSEAEKLVTETRALVDRSKAGEFTSRGPLLRAEMQVLAYTARAAQAEMEADKAAPPADLAAVGAVIRALSGLSSTSQCGFVYGLSRSHTGNWREQATAEMRSLMLLRKGK